MLEDSILDMLYSVLVCTACNSKTSYGRRIYFLLTTQASSYSTGKYDPHLRSARSDLHHIFTLY
jgi:hypothetical protein